MDEKFQWCANCNKFHYAIVDQEPIHLNAVVSDMQAKLRGRMAEGAPFSLQLEQFTKDGKIYWRALVKLGNGVWKSSRSPQPSPRYALRELSQIMESGQ
jgi:hypothetical protein